MGWITWYLLLGLFGGAAPSYNIARKQAHYSKLRNQ